MMENWLLNSGYPIIALEKLDEVGTYEITQKRMILSFSDKNKTNEEYFSYITVLFGLFLFLI